MSKTGKFQLTPLVYVIQFQTNVNIRKHMYIGAMQISLLTSVETLQRKFRHFRIPTKGKEYYPPLKVDSFQLLKTSRTRN